MAFQGISIKAKNFKCIGDIELGLDELKPINIAVGRNNAGKSTLLDLVQFVVTKRELGTRGH